jgi:Flp pilus assembly protein TadG
MSHFQMTKGHKKCISVRHGAAAVEFAVVAPLFFLLLAGIMEFGQAFRIEHMLSIACRRGARSAVVEGATTSQVQNKVKAHCVQTLKVAEANITVEVAVNGNPLVDVSQALEGAEISVTVKVPYSKAGVGFYANMFANSTLSSTCLLEHE